MYVITDIIKNEIPVNFFLYYTLKLLQ